MLWVPHRLVNPPTSVNWPRRSAQTSVAAGADLTIIRGDGLVNGPSCGILLGTKVAIGRIVQHPLFSAWQLDPLRTAALLATVDVLRRPVARRRHIAAVAMPEDVRRESPQSSRADGCTTYARRRRRVCYSNGNAKPFVGGARRQRLAFVRRGTRRVQRRHCVAGQPFEGCALSDRWPSGGRSNRPRSADCNSAAR